MIEKIKSQKAGEVLRWQGRLLASAVDPVSEAKEWVDRRKVLLDSVKSVFVLGAGAGYHIAELLSRSQANVVVIEYAQEIVNAVLEIHRFNDPRLQILCCQEPRALRSCEPVKTGISGSFLVFSYEPSTLMEKDFYRDCNERLVGRDWASLNWQWQLNGFAALDSQPKIGGNREPLTIYDLEQTELVRNSEERERMLIKALRELVK